MPPRAASNPASGLTPEQLTTLAQAIADGKRATVYLREATPSLDLPAGASARAVRVEGTTVTLRPRGVDDELPFEAEELRITRSEPVAAASPGFTDTPTPPKVPRVRKAPAPRPAAPAPEVRQQEAVVPADSAPAEQPKPTARTPKRVQDGISVVIEAGIDGEWTVAVAYGGKPRGKPVPVSAEAVARAVAELGDGPARHAVDAVLVAARKSAAKKVAELSKQLDDARNALAALGSNES